MIGQRPAPLFEQIFRNHSSMMMLLDPRTETIVDVNQATSDFYGYTPEQMKGMAIAEIERSDKRALAQCTLNEVVNGHVDNFKLRHTLANGEQRLIQVHASPTEVEREQLIFCILHDITHHDHAARALASGKEIFRALIEHSLDLLLVVDERGEFAFASPSVQSTLGYKPEDLLGVRADSLLHPDDRARLKTTWEEIVDEPGTVAELKHRLRHADGTYRTLSSRVRNLLLNPMIQGFVVNSHDVSEEVRLDNELRSHAKKLEANNNELKEFAYVASHDLQEPLRKIRTFGDRLERQFSADLGERGTDYICRMNLAAERMSTLIEDLLEYSQLGTQLRPFCTLDLHRILEGVLTDLEVPIREREATFDISDLHSMDGDRMMLRQFLQNMISNALKFASEERTAHIIIQTREIESDNIPMIELSIEDNGIGFDQKYANNIFQPFQRLHGRNAYKGTGIGLAICRKIVAHHGGCIHAFGAPDDGATFVARFPRHHESTRDTPTTQEAPT